MVSAVRIRLPGGSEAVIRMPGEAAVTNALAVLTEIDDHFIGWFMGSMSHVDFNNASNPYIGPGKRIIVCDLRLCIFRHFDLHFALGIFIWQRRLYAAGAFDHCVG